MASTMFTLLAVIAVIGCACVTFSAGFPARNTYGAGGWALPVGGWAVPVGGVPGVFGGYGGPLFRGYGGGFGVFGGY